MSQGGSIPVAPDPDTSFEPTRVVETGWSEPVFIVKVGADQFFLTKVVWPYDRSVAGSLPVGDPKRDSFDLVESLFDAGTKLQAVNIAPIEDDATTSGFTSGMAHGTG